MMDAKTNQQEFSNNLLNYLNNSPTAYHAVENASDILRNNGFKELREQESWSLEKGGRYFVTKNKSGLIAFTIGEKDLAEHGFRIIGTHTDSPSFKIKPGSCTVTSDGYVKLNTEVYGGPILSTWFDRPLSIAGKLVLRNDDGGVWSRIINIHEPVLIIPNLCIHFQREVNQNGGYNKQSDILPLLGMKKEGVDKSEYLLNLLEEKLRIDKDEIIDYELFLYEYAEGMFTGEQKEFISASRIDDLAMVYCGLSGLLSSRETGNSKIFAAFDNEEVGSTSVPGASSAFLLHTLGRICKNRGLNDDDYFRTLANSNSISADTAHAVHPNYSDKHDPENRPVLGGGPVIKYSASQKYATTAATAAYFILACEKAQVPYQKFVNRNDIVGGSTIGPASSSLTTIPAVDIGTPVLAMHSVREFGCVVDNVYTAEAFRAYYDMMEEKHSWEM